MKEIRNPTLRYLKVKAIYPKVFFHYCNKCRYEFRNTMMWSYKDSSWWDTFTSYLCTDCAPEVVDVYKYILDKEEFKKFFGKSKSLV
jgi:hypothetical protein